MWFLSGYIANSMSLRNIIEFQGGKITLDLKFSQYIYLLLCRLNKINKYFYKYYGNL